MGKLPNIYQVRQQGIADALLTPTEHQTEAEAALSQVCLDLASGTLRATGQRDTGLHAGLVTAEMAPAVCRLIDRLINGRGSIRNKPTDGEGDGWIPLTNESPWSAKIYEGSDRTNETIAFKHINLRRVSVAREHNGHQYRLSFLYGEPRNYQRPEARMIDVSLMMDAHQDYTPQVVSFNAVWSGSSAITQIVRRTHSFMPTENRPPILNMLHGIMRLCKSGDTPLIPKAMMFDALQPDESVRQWRLESQKRGTLEDTRIRSPSPEAIDRMRHEFEMSEQEIAEAKAAPQTSIVSFSAGTALSLTVAELENAKPDLFNTVTMHLNHPAEEATISVLHFTPVVASLLLDRNITDLRTLVPGSYF